MDGWMDGRVINTIMRAMQLLYTEISTITAPPPTREGGVVEIILALPADIQ